MKEECGTSFQKPALQQITGVLTCISFCFCVGILVGTKVRKNPVLTAIVCTLDACVVMGQHLWCPKTGQPLDLLSKSSCEVLLR